MNSIFGEGIELGDLFSGKSLSVENAVCKKCGLNTRALRRFHVKGLSLVPEAAAKNIYNPHRYCKIMDPQTDLGTSFLSQCSTAKGLCAT